MLQIQHGLFLNIDFIRRLFAINQSDVIANLALDAHIGNKPLARFCVNARQIARIRIAVRVTVFDVEQKNKVVSVLHD